MSRSRLCGLALVAAALVAPPPGQAQAVGGGLYMVKNNSSERLKCRYRVDDGEWGPSFRMRRGAEFSLRQPPGTSGLAFFCERPAKRVSYLLRPGERYSLLRADDGAIELRAITAGGG